MRSVLFAFTLVAIFGMFFYPVYATNLSTDKSSYIYGDIMHISGIVSPVQEGQFIILQIINPGNSDIVTADQFLPAPNGAFSKSYPAEGPKWTQDGTYTVKIFYGDWSEITFQFQSESVPEPPYNSDSEKTNDGESPVNPEPQNNEQDNIIVEFSKTQAQSPKTKIPGFPDLNKSPNYYYERYEKESSYKNWFNSQFPNLSIEDVVGYQPTHVPGFPDPANSPQSYIERYNNEPAYKNWFNSQFPGKTIYEILGFPEPIRIPDWIKDNADWWATGKISDSDFISGIQYMIEKNIIAIPNIPESSESGGTVPEWIRNNAGWWAYDRITDDDFVKGLEFLVEKGIILIK